MYCGSVDGLTDEHVIPYALGGTLVLAKSSCRPCAAKTSLYELKVLRGFMSDARLVARLPSRRKKERPSAKRHSFLDGHNVRRSVELPVTESMGLLHLPIFTDCAYISSQPAVKDCLVCGFDTVRFGEDVSERLKGMGAIGMEDKASIEVSAFARVLAKIAYGYYVAQRGVFPRAESPALALALGECDNVSNWIGSAPPLPTPPAAHGIHALLAMDLQRSDGVTVTVVRVGLFRTSGARSYDVVARAPGWKQYDATARPHQATGA